MNEEVYPYHKPTNFFEVFQINMSMINTPTQFLIIALCAGMYPAIWAHKKSGSILSTVVSILTMPVFIPSVLALIVSGILVNVSSKITESTRYAKYPCKIRLTTRQIDENTDLINTVTSAPVYEGGCLEAVDLYFESEKDKTFYSLQLKVT